MDYNFPQFRKYPNNKNYFKIISTEVFEEISFIAGKVIKTTYKAKILPDRNLILDMLENKDGIWVEIDEKEYESITSV